MLAFLSRRLQLWILLALGVPVVAWVLSFVGSRIEARTGSTKITRMLRKAGGWLGRRARGPLAPEADGSGS